MADVKVTRADREAAVRMHTRTPTIGGVGSSTARTWVETGDDSDIVWGPWRTCLSSLATQIAELRATARAEGYAAGVEEAANVVLAHAREAASRAGEVATDAEAKAACMALALDDAAKDVRALAAREGE